MRKKGSWPAEAVKHEEGKRLKQRHEGEKRRELWAALREAMMHQNERARHSEARQRQILTSLGLNSSRAKNLSQAAAQADARSLSPMLWPRQMPEPSVDRPPRLQVLLDQIHLCHGHTLSILVRSRPI